MITDDNKRSKEWLAIESKLLPYVKEFFMGKEFENISWKKVCPETYIDNSNEKTTFESEDWRFIIKNDMYTDDIAFETEDGIHMSIDIESTLSYFNNCYWSYDATKIFDSIYRFDITYLLNEIYKIKEKAKDNNGENEQLAYFLIIETLMQMNIDIEKGRRKSKYVSFKEMFYALLDNDSYKYNTTSVNEEKKKSYLTPQWTTHSKYVAKLWFEKEYVENLFYDHVLYDAENDVFSFVEDGKCSMFDMTFLTGSFMLPYLIEFYEYIQKENDISIFSFVLFTKQYDISADIQNDDLFKLVYLPRKWFNKSYYFFTTLFNRNKIYIRKNPQLISSSASSYITELKYIDGKLLAS